MFVKLLLLFVADRNDSYGHACFERTQRVHALLGVAVRHHRLRHLRRLLHRVHVHRQLRQRVTDQRHTSDFLSIQVCYCNLKRIFILMTSLTFYSDPRFLIWGPYQRRQVRFMYQQLQKKETFLLSLKNTHAIQNLSQL